MIARMSTASFVVAFDGPGVLDDTIDVRDLAPALLSLGKAVDAANRAINGDQVPARIEVKATATGCFEVDLNLVLHGWAAIKGVLLVDDSQAAMLLLGYLGFGYTGVFGLIKFYRWLAGRTIETAKQDGSLITITAGAETITVPMEVLRLYQEVAVNQAVGELLNTLENDRIEKIEFRPSRRAPPTETLTKADREAFVLPKPKDETVVDETRRMALSIRSLAFQEGNKWRLYDGQNVITATIEDKVFLGRVDRSEVRFAKSDVLVCLVQTIQKQGAEGLKTEHVVKQVLEYRAAPLQIDLFGLTKDGSA